MMLNLDCVRAVLLVVESSPIGRRIDLNTLQNELPDYGKNDIHYACIKLNEAEYLDIILSRALRADLPTVVKIKDISFAGHEFLNSIRDDGNWGKVKEAAKDAGTSSLKTLADIAFEVAKAAILSKLQLSQ